MIVSCVPELESDEIRSAVGVVYGRTLWLSDAPLIPNLVICPAPPNAHCQLLLCHHLHWLLNGEVDRKPAGHVWCMCGWQDAEVDMLVQHSIKVASKTVADAWLLSRLKDKLTVA